MKVRTQSRTKVVGNIRTTTRIVSTDTVWKRVPTSWQLPCGCINPDIWTSDDVEQAECTDCGRQWKHMTTFCDMLDKQPQGKPVFVLTEAMMA